MKDSEERRERLSLTLLFSGLVFLFLLGTMLLVAFILYLLLQAGVLQMKEESMRAGTLIIVIALTSVLVGTLLSVTAGKYPLRSVNRVINAMNRLAAGDFKTRLEFSGPLRKLTVVRELTESFNKMASELENTELLRGDFINNFAHEFRTPIVSIAGFAKLLKKGGLSPEEEQEYLDIIESESLRLNAMATSFLNLTRIENQTILADVTKYNLSEQLRGCVLLLEDKWSRKDIELILNFKEHMIRANEELMENVWINLLDNAVKFTPEGGSIEIAIYEEPGAVSVAVINTGSEIPAESRDRIFRKFYQADESHTQEGNGIGLAVVKKIVELHEGSVAVDSREGQTVFTVTLPNRAEEPA